MDAAVIEARFTRMEQEIAELRRENQSLRAVVPQPKQDAKEGEVLPRRQVLKGAAYALGAVGVSLMGTRPAEAATGTMRYGAYNDAGDSVTELFSRGRQTLSVQNNSADRGAAILAISGGGDAFRAQVLSKPGTVGDGLNVLMDGGGQGHGLHVVKSGELGNGVLAFQNSPTSFYGAIAGVTKGAGPGLYGRGEGSGYGVWGQIADAAKTQSAVLGTTEGTGAAIEGTSIRGRGAVFKGKKAPIRLMPSSTTTKPATGSRGDLFVDSTGRLWYCKTGGSTTGWKQLA